MSREGLTASVKAKMEAEGAVDWSDAEIERCLGNTVLRTKVIAEAKRIRSGA